MWPISFLFSILIDCISVWSFVHWSPRNNKIMLLDLLSVMPGASVWYKANSAIMEY